MGLVTEQPWANGPKTRCGCATHPARNRGSARVVARPKALEVEVDADTPDAAPRLPDAPPPPAGAPAMSFSTDSSKSSRSLESGAKALLQNWQAFFARDFSRNLSYMCLALSVIARSFLGAGWAALGALRSPQRMATLATEIGAGGVLNSLAALCGCTRIAHPPRRTWHPYVAAACEQPGWPPFRRRSRFRPRKSRGGLGVR